MADWNRLLSLCEIVAVCDADAARAEAFAREFGIARSYTDAAQMLSTEKPDFADIATRPESHFALAD